MFLASEAFSINYYDLRKGASQFVRHLDEGCPLPLANSICRLKKRGGSLEPWEPPSPS